MDRDKLFRQLEQRYSSKRDMLNRIPLGIQPDTLWQELLNRRRSKATVLSLYGSQSAPYWYVTTDRMIAASEKIVGTLLENETDFDPYVDPPAVSSLEEVFYTGYVEGAQITMQAAMSFLTGGQAPRDIEEQLIANNRQAGAYATANLYRPIDAPLLKELYYLLTEGLDNGGQEYRTEDVVDFSPPPGEQFSFPDPRCIPDRIEDLFAFLGSPAIHPLIKAAVAQAYMMVLRPFPEGNDRLARILSSMILLRAGYTFFSDVSLSALIARKSYGYYEATANILREENGQDLTYFIEYFFDLLSRGIDERQFRRTRKEETAQQTEIELARTPLTPISPPPPPDNGPREHSPEQENSVNAQEDACVTDLSGFQSVPVSDSPIDLLNGYAKTSSLVGQVSSFLLQMISTGQTQFTAANLAASLQIDPCRIGGCIRHLKEEGIIYLESDDNSQRQYRICTGEPDPALSHSGNDFKCEAAVLDLLDELRQSHSPKDKRISAFLSQNMAKGEITTAFYSANGEATKWAVDMRFAEQLGLVKRKTASCYTILRKLNPGPLLLNKGQRKFIRKIYDSFGNDVFSTEMVFATLDYSDSNISAYLHQFTLFKLIDCRKEDVFRYQCLINPTANPEYFDMAV